MFSHADVTALVRDRRLKSPVASFYLNTDRTHPEGEKYLATLRALVHRADRLLASRSDTAAALARQRLQDSLPDLLEFLDARVAPESIVRGAALFVSLSPTADHELRSPAFTAFTLPRPVRSQARVDHRPYIRPLLFLLDQYERAGLIVADRNHARIFTLFLGEMETLQHLTSDTPRRHDQGGWKQMLFQRDIDGHTKAHIRRAVRAAVNTFGAQPLRRIVLGGSKETLALLREELPKRFGGLIAGEFRAAPHAPDAELVAKALAIAAAAEQHEEAQRVEELASALAHRAAARGLSDTLKALSEKRAVRLVLQRGFKQPGGVCDNCGSLFAAATAPCPHCSFPVRAVPDVLEHAVERAESERTEIEFVTESPTLAALGGVGALLRF